MSGGAFFSQARKGNDATYSGTSAAERWILENGRRVGGEFEGENRRRRSSREEGMKVLRNGETRKFDRDPSRKEVDVVVKVDKPRTYRDALIGRE